MKKKWIWLAVFIYTLWIFSNSLMNGEISGSTSGSITRYIFVFLQKYTASLTFDGLHHFIRKAAHFSEYALLGVFVYTAQKKAPLPGYHQIVYILFGLLTPVLDETIQRFVPDRYGSFVDVLLDMSGYLTGLLFIYLLCRLVHQFTDKAED